MSTSAEEGRGVPAPARPMTAVALEHRIDWEAFSPLGAWRELRRYPYGRTFAVDGGVLYLFGFGAAVYEGVERLSDRLRGEIEGCVGRRILPVTEEVYFVAVDPNADQGAPRVGWDRVVIPDQGPELVAAVALLLAQSAALERYELVVDSLLDQTLVLARQLARRARLLHGTRELSEHLGRLTGDRLELARWFFLVDRPAETWEHSRVSQLYDALFANLELRQRHDAMLHKLGAAERATQSALDMWQGRMSNALEWAIVVLIVVEIVFGVWGLV